MSTGEGGLCKRCGTELFLRPHWPKLRLHQDCADEILAQKAVEHAHGKDCQCRKCRPNDRQCDCLWCRAYSLEAAKRQAEAEHIEDMKKQARREERKKW